MMTEPSTEPGAPGESRASSPRPARVGDGTPLDALVHRDYVIGLERELIEAKTEIERLTKLIKAMSSRRSIRAIRAAEITARKVKDRIQR